MKTWKLLLCVLISICLSAGAPVAQPAPPPAASAAPASQDDPPFFTIIGDYAGGVAQAGIIVNAIMPSMSPEMLKAALGMQNQDPELKGLPAGSGMLLIYNSESKSEIRDRFVGYLEVAPPLIETYKASAIARGEVADIASGLVLTCKKPEDLEYARKMAPVAKRILEKEPASPTIRLIFRMDRLLSNLDYDTAVQAMEDKPKSGKDKLDLHAALLAAHEFETITAELRPSAQGIEIAFTVVPKKDSNLASLLSTPAGNPTDLAGLLPEKGSIRMAVAINSAALEKFADQIVEAAYKESKASPQDRDVLLAENRQLGGVGWDEYAASFYVPGQPLMTGTSVVRLKEPGKAMASIEQAAEKMKSPAVIKAFEQRNLKADVQIKKNAREYKGTQIHQVTLTITPMGGAPAPETGRTVPQNIQYSTAIVDNLMLSALGSESLDTLIDAAKNKGNPSGKTLQAAALIPNDPKFLMDLEGGKAVELLMGAFAEVIPGGKNAAREMEQKAAALAGAKPISLAVAVQSGTLQGKILIPLDLVGKVGQMLIPAAEGAPQPAGPGESSAPAPAPF